MLKKEDWTRSLTHRQTDREREREREEMVMTHKVVTFLTKATEEWTKRLVDSVM